MARIIVILLVAAGAAWYYFVGGRKIDESHVREAYAKYWSAFDANDGKAICELFDQKFKVTVKTSGTTGPTDIEGTRAEVCAATGKFYEKKAEIEQKTGMEMHVNVEYTVVSVDISRDGKLATARVDSEVRMGTEQRAFVTIKESQTDTLTRNLGSVKFMTSEGTVSIR